MTEVAEKHYERAMVVSAHPDDPEFGAGATVAWLSDSGVEVAYVICTDGSQGGEDPHVRDADLSATRYQEQREAAAVLGVHDVTFLGFKDGHLEPNVELRRAITRQLRRFRPDLVITHHPLRQIGIAIGASHPDHLAVGEATLSAVYPDARNPRAYRDLLYEGLEAHKVGEVWIQSWEGANHHVDATPYVERKVEAIRCHRSQWQKPGGDPEQVAGWVRTRMRTAGESVGVEYAELFRRLETG